MDELTMLAQLRADVAEPTPEALRTARTRLTEQDVRPAVLTLRPSRGVRAHYSLRWRAAISLSAAAAVAAGAFALASGGSDPHRAPVPQAAPSSSDSPAPRFVTAAQLLDAASAGALRDGAPTLAAGQFRYFRTHGYGVTSIDDPPGNGAYEFSEYTNEQWLPAADTGKRYLRSVNDITVHYPTALQERYAAAGPGGIPTRQVEWDVAKPGGDYQQVYPHVDNPPTEIPCTGADCSSQISVWDEPTASTLAALPQDAAGLRASLYQYAEAAHADATKYGKGGQLSVDDAAYAGVTNLLTSDIVSSDLRAALYQVAKTVPGITLIGSLANYDGTQGIAIGRVDAFGVEHDLIFAGSGSTYIGDRTVATRPSAEYKVQAGTLLGYTAVTTGVQGAPDVPR